MTLTSTCLLGEINQKHIQSSDGNNENTTSQNKQLHHQNPSINSSTTLGSNWHLRPLWAGAKLGATKTNWSLIDHGRDVVAYTPRGPSQTRDQTTNSTEIKSYRQKNPLRKMVGWRCTPTTIQHMHLQPGKLQHTNHQ